MSQHVRKAASAGYLESSAPLPSPAPSNNHGSKRDRILEAGLKLFANEPYQAVTMDRVAELAGVAKGTLYLYFQSKEDLYLGILSDGMETMSRNYQSSVDPNADVKVRLRSAITLSVEFYSQRRDLLRLMMTEEPRMAEARNRIRDEWRDRGVRFFTSLIEEGIQSGAFDINDAHLATYAILGSMRTVMLFYGAQRSADQIGAELGEMLVRGLSAGTSSATSSNHRKASHHQ
ncbi:MAG: TetR/AcrR family transcriptional regulator [Candidatus Binataceae bacterium]